MKVSALTAYVDRKNSFAKIFGGKELSLQNASDRKLIAQSIDCDLSPENLSCDGELPYSQIRARLNSLTKAGKELVALDPTMAQYIYELV